MSVLSQVIGLPGVRAAKTATHRIVTRGGYVPTILPQGRIVSGAASRDPGNSPDIGRLRAGTLMGKITTVVNSLGTVGYYAPAVIDAIANAVAAGATSLTLSAAGATELARRAGNSGTFTLTGPGVSAGPVQSETATYSAINTSTGVVTVTALVNNYIAGSLAQPTDGSQDPITFIGNGWPLQVLDVDGSNADVEFAALPVECIVDSVQLLPVWPSDTSLQEWIVSRLSRASGGKFIFNHLY